MEVTAETLASLTEAIAQKDYIKFSFYVGLNHQEASLVALQAYKKTGLFIFFWDQLHVYSQC